MKKKEIMKIIKLVPRLRTSWVGKKYEDAILIGFGRDRSIILLTKMKGRERQITTSNWTPDFWKVPPYLGEKNDKL